jgi:tetratricopeptide (TPR) repeat protein
MADLKLENIRQLDEVIERKKFYQKSLDLFLLMIEKEPKNPPAWGHIGLLLYELGRFDESLKYFAMITDDDPKNTISWDAQGFINMETGDFVKAAACFKRVIEIDTKRVDVASDLSLCLYHVGELDDAERILCDYLKKRSGTKEYFILGRIDEKRGGDGIENFKKSIDSYNCPDGPVREAIYASLNQIMGIIFSKLGDNKNAKAALTEAGERASLTDPDRMILSGLDLTYKVRADFIAEVKGLFTGI